MTPPLTNAVHGSPADWQLGIGQAHRDERAEIDAAKAAGRADEYLAAQAAARAPGTEALRSAEDALRAEFAAREENETAISNTLRTTSRSSAESSCSSFLPVTSAGGAEGHAEWTGVEVEDLLSSAAAGRLQADDVILPALPDNPTRATRTVADFYALLLGLRRGAGLPDLVPFAVDWVARHTGLPPKTVSRTLWRLHDTGVIVWSGKTLANPKTRLWEPGGTVQPTGRVGVDGPLDAAGDGAGEEVGLGVEEPLVEVRVDDSLSAEANPLELREELLAERATFAEAAGLGGERDSDVLGAEGELVHDDGAYADEPTPRPTPSILAELASRRAVGGQRNDTGLWLACQLRDNGFSEGDAMGAMLDYQRAVGGLGGHPYTVGEALKTMRSAYGRPPRDPWG